MVTDQSRETLQVKISSLTYYLMYLIFNKDLKQEESKQMLIPCMNFVQNSSTLITF